MADKRRFELFAEFLRGRFPDFRRVYDVAGGMGRLNVELARVGFDALTYDVRAKRLPVAFAERRFSLGEPCDCDLIVGMHPDGATRLIVQYAAQHHKPFSIVPCCSDDGSPYRTWMKVVRELAEKAGYRVEESLLPMAGRARVLTGLLSDH